jgi:hypothetical protein
MRTTHRHVPSGRRGWTRVESLFAAGLVTVVAANAALVLKRAGDLAADEASALGDQEAAGRVLDRIALALMESDRASLMPQAQDVHTDCLRFTGTRSDRAAGLAVLQEIGLDAGSTLRWRQRPGTSDERCETWTDLVSPLLAGELVNGIDDNGNGLIDEQGLSFVVEGRRVTVRLTLRRPDASGDLAEQTVERVVTFRNGCGSVSR